MIADLPVIPEVVFGNNTAEALYIFDEEWSEGAVVYRLRALLGYDVQCVG